MLRTGISGTLQSLLRDTQKETEYDKSRESVKRLKQLIRDAPPLLSFASALSSGRALIAEIKERSPSQGKMRSRNVQEAPHAYKRCALVKAISVLTNRTHFGPSMRIGTLKRIKELTSKPVLRKEFITEEYQVYQARAYGADAILLMANVLDAESLRRLSELAAELGLDVLFETHSADELQDLPPTASIIGINCRNFDGGLTSNNFRVARFFRQWLGRERDHSVNTSRFEYANKLPAEVIKVAESGITAKNCAAVFSMGFQSVLVGTSLLMDPRGVAAALEEFEVAIRESTSEAGKTASSLRPATA